MFEYVLSYCLRGDYRYHLNGNSRATAATGDNW